MNSIRKASSASGRIESAELFLEDSLLSIEVREALRVHGLEVLRLGTGALGHEHGRSLRLPASDQALNGNPTENQTQMFERLRDTEEPHGCERHGRAPERSYQSIWSSRQFTTAAWR